MRTGWTNKYRFMHSGCLGMLMLGLLSCQGDRKETPTKGHATVIVSESVSPLMAAEKSTFEQLYPDARVTLEVAHAREAIARLFNDTIKLVVASRPLNAEERAVAANAKLQFSEYKIAIDAIAVIVNVSNPVERLRTSQLDSILTGKIETWNQAGGTSSSPIELCFPSRNSGTFETVGEKIIRGGVFAKPSAVTATSPEMVEFISGHPDAIGMLGLNWLADNKEKVKVLELADPDAPDSLGTRGKYYRPHQAYVFQGFYPLTREIYFYSRADLYSVGIGFVSFVTSAPGQKIVLNSGLVPATMPVRLVQLTSEGQKQ
jgi:phosphate transport system substrate-binding protein